MESNKVLLLVNPKAGKGKAVRAISRWMDDFPSLAAEVEVVEIPGPGEGLNIAREYIRKGGKRIVAAGGDGTIHEILPALVQSKAELGIIPLGSGNGLARHLHIPLDIDKAMRLALFGISRTVDTGKANGIPFSNVCGAGFDAEVISSFRKRKKRGFSGYVSVITGLIFSYKGQKLTWRAGSKTETRRVYMLTFCNITQYGNDALIAPQARDDDGKLDMILLPPVQWSKIPDLVYSLLGKGWQPGKHVYADQITQAEVELAEPYFQLDGEYVDAPSRRIKLAVNPLSLRVICRYEKE